MLSTLRNAWKVPELRKRLLFTLFVIVLFRMGNNIPVPGVDAAVIAQSVQSGTTIFSFYDLFSGGAFSNFSIFALAVTPYINASIIFSLLAVAIPSLESLQKEGQEGRKKIQKYTKYASLVFAVIMSFGTIALISNFGALKDTSALSIALIVITLTTGSTILMWLGDQITAHGLGNGVSLIIFANIISRLPSDFMKLFANSSISIVSIVIYIAITLALLVGVIIVNMSERRIPVQYAGKAVGGKVYKGQNSHIPVNVNGSIVIAIIFAMTVMNFPATIGMFFQGNKFFDTLLNSSWSIFNPKSFPYAIAFFLLIIFFCWFYTEIQLKPEEMAENMHKSSGFIPGVRPGDPTRIFLEKVIGRISVLGGCFAGMIAVFPIIVAHNPSFEGLTFGGTSLLIMVSVAIETMKTLESQLVMRHYQGFLK